MVLHWRVIALASLAVVLLLGGLLALVLPSPYEGAVLYTFNDQHAIRALDGLGLLLVLVGCLAAWGAGAAWQRRMHVS